MSLKDQWRASSAKLGLNVVKRGVVEASTPPIRIAGELQYSGEGLVLFSLPEMLRW